jgi:MoaA/NifB/PqqE/SkfB family radical SAM enzyme
MFDKLGGLLQLKRRRPYRLFQVEPSLKCNLACVMCPWGKLHSEAGLMAWDTFARIAANFRLAQEVDLTGGGEPATHPRLADMVRVAKEAGCEVGFSTNGTLLNSDLAETLVSLGQDWISFSIDAATAETYERIRQGAQFEAVMRNVEALRDMKAARRSQTPKMMLVFVMMHENFHEVPAYVDLAHELGVEQIIFKNLDVILKEDDDKRRLFSHAGRPEANLDQAIAEARQRAGKWGIGLRLYALQPSELAMCEQNPLQNIFFNWAGYVSPCITLSYAESRIFDGVRQRVACRRFGNVNHESLEQIWNGAAYREFRRVYETRLHLEQQATVDLFMGSPEGEPPEWPPAPEECRICYYLYGV